MNTRSIPAFAALATAALLSPVAASAGTVSVGTAYSFDLVSVDQPFVDAQHQYDGVDGYFVGFQQLELGGFTAATGLSIDRLESVTLRLEGSTSSVGSGGVYASAAATLPETSLTVMDLDEYATERNSATGSGINVTDLASLSSTADLSAFASDSLTLGVWTNIAFYGFLGQVTGEGNGFTSSGFATLDYTFSDAAATANATAVPTPSAALAGLFGLGGLCLKRRKKA